MANGESPFATWLRSLKDKRARARIRLRLDRLSRGNLGDYDAVGGGVLELRLHFGPGYRIYVAEDSPVIVLLLCGGIKRSQRLLVDRFQNSVRIEGVDAPRPQGARLRRTGGTSQGAQRRGRGCSGVRMRHYFGIDPLDIKAAQEYWRDYRRRKP